MAQLKHTLFFALVIIVIAIVILAVVSQGGGVSNTATVITDVPPTEAALQEQAVLNETPIEELKQGILKRVRSGAPLTQAEKQNYISVLSGQKFHFFNFTQEEQDMVINALNR